MPDRLGIRGRDITIYVRFYDPAGNPINADTTPRVEVTDPNGVVQRALSTTGVSNIQDVKGLYSFSYSIPINFPDGYAEDRWVVTLGGETVENTFMFFVQEAGTIVQDIEPVFEPTGTSTFDFEKCEQEGIDCLIKVLKKRLKNDGVRRVPDGMGGFTTEPCSVFSDDELICFLINSLSEFNAWPHFTNFSFCDSQTTGIFSDIITQGAVLLALAAQTLIEKGREFSITDNGVVYNAPQVADMLNNQYSTQLGYYKEKLKMIKTSLKPSAKSLGTFRVTSVSPMFMRLRHLRARQIL